MIFPIFSALFSLAGAGLSFFGQQQAAKNSVAAAKAQQAAAYADASNTAQQAAENARRARVNNRRDLARIRGTMAGTSGMEFSGSFADAFAETAGRLEMQVQDAARAADLEARNARSRGDMALWEGRTQAAALKMRSYGTLLSDATAAGTQFYQGIR
jgi:NADH dehydrogenase FAD-containing subunit